MSGSTIELVTSGTYIGTDSNRTSPDSLHSSVRFQVTHLVLSFSLTGILGSVELELEVIEVMN